VAEVVDREQVGVEESREKAGLHVKPLAELEVGRHRARKHLQRDICFQRSRVRAVDDGHPALAEYLANDILVVAQPEADQAIGGRHWRRSSTRRVLSCSVTIVASGLVRGLTTVLSSVIEVVRMVGSSPAIDGARTVGSSPAVEGARTGAPSPADEG